MMTGIAEGIALFEIAIRWIGALRLPRIICCSFAFTFCVFALAGCVGQVAKIPPPPSPPPGQTARFGHVIIVVEENHNYADVVASPSMSYLNNLANQNGLATNYFANGHPSIPNYFMLTTGQNLTLIDALTPDLFPVSEDNVIHELITAGKT